MKNNFQTIISNELKKLIVFVLIFGTVCFGLLSSLKTKADTDFIGDGTYNFTCGQRIQLNNGVILETQCSSPYGINHVYFNAYDSNLNSLDQVGGFDQENLPRTNSYTLGSYSFRITINSISVNQSVFNISGIFLSTKTYCTSWTYSDWGGCVNNQTTRTISTSSPAGCTGGNPILYKPCPDANNALYIGDATYSLAQGDRIKLNNGITVEPIYSTVGSGDNIVYYIAFKVYDSNSNYLGTSDNIRAGITQRLVVANYIFQAYITSVGKQEDNIWRSTISLSSINNLYTGDGTYTFTEGQKVKLNNGAIIQPVYSVTGSGNYEFQNINFKVSDSYSNYLGTTNITRVGWTEQYWSVGGYMFQSSISNLGALLGNWSGTITLTSLTQLPTCTSWTYSNWSTCTNNQQTRTILSSSPINCIGGNPTLTQSCNTNSNAISNVQITTTQNSATITWDSVNSYKSYILWGMKNTDNDINTVVQDLAYTTSHALTINNLAPNTTYYFKIDYGAIYNGKTESQIYQFTTLNTSNNPISNVNVITTHNSAKITWNSSEPSKSYILWGTNNTDNDIGRVVQNLAQTTIHELIINNLAPNTTYYFKIDYGAIYNGKTESPILLFTTRKQITNPDKALSNKLRGKLLLDVEDKGRIWYINPGDSQKYEITFGNAMSLFKRFSLGISNKNLSEISEIKSTILGNKLKGKLLLQVEDRGRIWYIDQSGLKHEVTWTNLMDLFRRLSLGIDKNNLDKIQNGNIE